MSEQTNLFGPPAHEVVIEARAREIEAWVAEQFAKWRYDIDQRFRGIVARHNRSIAQIRRFRRLRFLLQEKTA